MKVTALIAGERYNVNIGQVDDPECAMRRHVTHLLCLQPMSHSELVKLLPEDVRPSLSLGNYSVCLLKLMYLKTASVVQNWVFSFFTFFK